MQKRAQEPWPYFPPHPQSLNVLGEQWYQRLCEGIAEYQFGSNDKDLQIEINNWYLPEAKITYFGRQALEESRRALIFNEFFHNSDTRYFSLKVGVLDAGLDRI